MGWETDLLGARFRGIPFQVVALTDQGGKTLVIHEYPYRSGGAVEDMGCTARSIPIKAVFWGTNYAFDMQQLVQALEKPGAGELIHPVFGSVQVTIRSWTIEHKAERPDYAELVFEAIVSTLDEAFFQYVTPKSQAEQAINRAKSTSKEVLEQASLVCVQAIESYATTPLAQAELSQKLTTILNVYDQKGQVPRSLGLFIFQPQVFITELLAVQQTVITSTSSSSGMEKYLLWSSQFPRLDPSKGLTDTLSGYPVQPRYWSKTWISGGRAGVYTQTPSITTLKENMSFNEKPYAKNHTIEAVLLTYTLLSQTFVCVTEVCQFLFKEVFSQTTEYTPMEIDAIIGVLRMRIQDCLDGVRSTFPQEYVYRVSESLRTLAGQVQIIGTTIHKTRPFLSFYTVKHEESLHLLAFRLYGDASRYQELLRLNPQIQNPNVLPVGQELRIYKDKGASL